MAEILSGQTLEVDNLLSFRGKIKQTDIEFIGRDMENKINLAGANRIGTPITVTYGIEEDELEIEILIPIDKPMESIGKYLYKEKIRIVNAIVVKHRGNPGTLQNTCNELNQYMAEHKLMPITAGYNVTKRMNPVDIQDTEIEVYVGVSPNIL